MSNATRKLERFQTNLGDSWWWRRYADLVDRRQEDGTVQPFNYDAATKGYVTRWQRYKIKARGGVPQYPPLVVQRPGASRPEMLPRPEGMSRQQHRRLYRESCKLAGVPWKAERLFKTPRRERGRNWKDLSPEELAKLEADWAEFMTKSLEVK